MKNSKIHEGLPQSELRDFFSLGIVKNHERSRKLNTQKNEKYESIAHLKGLDWNIAHTELTMKHFQKELERLNELKSFTTLIKSQGWEEFDVSEETERDPKYFTWMDFIGTKEEYENFIKNIKD